MAQEVRAGDGEGRQEGGQPLEGLLPSWLPLWAPQSCWGCREVVQSLLQGCPLASGLPAVLLKGVFTHQLPSVIG